MEKSLLKKTLCTVLALVCTTCYGCAKDAAQTLPQGSFLVQVTDLETGEPIPGAAVCVPQTGMTYLTDEAGSTGTIEAPVQVDARFSAVYPQTWGEVTLLIYAKGYIPCALFHVMIWPDQVRQGPNITLAKEDGSMGMQPYIIVEAPQRVWVQGLLERFEPE